MSVSMGQLIGSGLCDQEGNFLTGHGPVGGIEASMIPNRQFGGDMMGNIPLLFPWLLCKSKWLQDD